jgi:hypothetical protein
VGEVEQYVGVASLQHVDMAAHIEDTFGYDINAYTADVLYIVLIGVVMRVVACVCLCVLDRKKKI